MQLGEFDMNKKAIAIVAGVFIFGAVVGRVSASDCSIDYHGVAVKENEQLVTKVESLQKKVDDAKPYFEMKQSEQLALKEKAEKNKKDEETKSIEENTKTLSSGHFMAGTDFNAGKYNIEVVSGNGNVHSNNSKNGINAIMGTREDSMYQKSFNNVYLPFGTTLTIDGVTIKLIPVELNNL